MKGKRSERRREAFGEKEKGEGGRKHAEEGRSIIDKSEAREDAKRWGKGEGRGGKKARGRRKKYNR